MCSLPTLPSEAHLKYSLVLLGLADYFPVNFEEIGLVNIQIR